jgi:hypothetical protein
VLEDYVTIEPAELEKEVAEYNRKFRSGQAVYGMD